MRCEFSQFYARELFALLKGTEDLQELIYGRDILSRINQIPLGGGQYVSDIRITTDYRCLYFNI